MPITLSQIAMLQKSPRSNAARMFINWMVSREGQVMQYADSFAFPFIKRCTAAVRAIHRNDRRQEAKRARRRNPPQRSQQENGRGVGQILECRLNDQEDPMSSLRFRKPPFQQTGPTYVFDIAAT